MNKRLFVLLFMLLPGLLQAQSDTARSPEKTKYGDVSPADFEQQVYAGDSAACAVVLYQKGETHFEHGGKGYEIHTYKHVRIRILSKEGYDYANVVLNYIDQENGPKEKITDLKAATYLLEEGQVKKIKMENDAVYEEKASKNRMAKKFSLPQVKEGAIIEYSYTIVSEFWDILNDWYFQREIPLVWSEYELSIPSYFEWAVVYRGSEAALIHETKERIEAFRYTWTSGTTIGSIAGVHRQGQGNAIWNVACKVSKWAVKELPGIRSEAFMTSPKDYMARLEFQLRFYRFQGWRHPRESLGSWQRLNSNLLGNDMFGGQINKAKAPKPIRDLAESLTKDCRELTEKMIAIYNYVQDSISWNGSYRLLSEDVNKVVESKSGSVGDINLLLIALLRQANVPSDPVVLSTRGNGIVDALLPSYPRLNYVIVLAEIGDKRYLLDATDDVRPWFLLPERCLAGFGWQIHPHQPQWVELRNTAKNLSFVLASASIDPDGALRTKIQSRAEGYPALKIREALLKKDDKQKFLAEQLAKELPGAHTQKISIENEKNPGEALKTSMELVIPEYAQLAGELIYIHPMLNQALSENPLKLSERRYPVDMPYGYEKSYSFALTIPEGYQPETLPAPVMLALPDKAAMFSYSVNVFGNTIQIMSQISFNKTSYPPQEYADLKEFFNRIVAKHAEQVVLKKIY